MQNSPPAPSGPPPPPQDDGLPPPRSPGPRMPLLGPACFAWSRHAAELAVPVSRALERWEDTPTTARMVADGYLVRLLPGIYVPPDVVGTAVGRALAVGSALGTSLRPHHVLAGVTAAWVVLGGTAPVQVELISTAHRGPIAGTIQRGARVAMDEVETVGGAPLTIPDRTAMDLLRFSPDAERLAAVSRLIAAGHASPEGIRRRLEAITHHPGSRSAQEAMDRACALVPAHDAGRGTRAA